MKTEQYTRLINEAIAQLEYPTASAGLYDPIKYVLSLGGKRIRPVLVLTATEMFGGKVESAIPAALCLEIFHNFTLLHDDVMDHADMRRGKPTVHCVWNENTAILSGDVMQILAFKQLLALPDYCLKEIEALFIKTATEICEGQQFDMEFEIRNRVNEEEYIDMIRLKTAVLLGCALKMGAIVSKADEKDADLIYKFGENIGLAFQLRDDLLDVYGDPTFFGKNIGGDILNNKKTFMLISALKYAKADTKAELISWLARKNFDKKEKIAAITRIYDKLNIQKICSNKMEFYYQTALSALQAINLPEEKKKPLLDLALKMMSRNV